MSCRGICTRYKATKIFGMGRYVLGQSRCTHCEIFIKWDGRNCPCCSKQLKKNPNSMKFKEKLKEIPRT